MRRAALFEAEVAGTSYGSEGVTDTACIDILTDMMHWFQSGNGFGTFDAALQMARIHFEKETEKGE